LSFPWYLATGLPDLFFTENPLQYGQMKSLRFISAGSIMFLLALGLWLIALFSLAELLDVFEVSEAREGVVVREIVDHNTWILPLRHGEIVPSKPPLFHIISASLSRITGEFTEFELRLPSLIAAGLSLIALYIFLLKLTNPLTAFAGAGILATSYGFLQLSIDGRVDMLFNLFHTIAYLVFTFNIIKHHGRAIKPLAAIVLSASIILSVYTKGPLGLVLFVLYSFPALYMEGSFGLVKKWYLHPASIMTVIGSSLWYVASIGTGQDGILSRHIIFENIQRFFGGSEIPAKPFWYYFLHIWTQTLPWGGLALLSLAWITLTGRHRKFFSDMKYKKLFKLVLIQSLIILLFLSLSSGKRRGYLLMLLPLFSIQITILLNPLYNIWHPGLDNHLKNRISSILQRISLISVLFPAFLTIASGVSIILDLNSSPDNYSIIIGFLNTSFHAFFCILLLCLTLYALIKYILGSSYVHSHLLALLSLTLQIYLAFPANFYLTKGESHSYMEFAERVKSWRSENNHPEIKFIKKRLDESFDTFFYYYGDRMSLAERVIPDKSGYYIARKSWLQEQRLPEQPEYTGILEGGKRKDRKENHIILFQYKEP
jgi:4-amino-4-deoxy-L-arabinose transferase-like glycosyltransferase